MEAINAFFDRVKKMQVGRSKEMRMTYDEAHKLSLDIAQLMAKKIKLDDDEPTQVIISGGGLKS